MFPRISEHRESLAAPEGRQIGPYRTYSKLPDRGFGVEYLGSKADGRPGDLVRLLALGTISSGVRKRLSRRFGEARRLAHPNLEPVLDLIEDRRSLVVVADRVAGVTLHDLLARHPGALDADTVTAIVLQAALGVQALHDHTDRRNRPLEWVHGHLSPRTILLCWTGRVVLLNVGFGELATANNDFQHFSPEQARSAPIDRRSDVFALGLILYQGLTGSRPFSDRSLPDYMLSVLADVPKNPHELRADLSPELVSITMRCLEREPEGRFSTARELAEALQSRAGFDTAAAESRLAALLAEHFPHERTQDEELLDQLAAEEVSLQSGAPAARAPRAGRRYRPLFLLLILAIALVIVVWAGVSRGASTC